MEDAIHGGGLAPQHTMRVYYTGSDKLLEGYALCFNFDASDVSAENLTLSAGIDEECSARRLQVEKPNLNNCVHFAGVVSARSNGFTGPGWIEINRPGSVCNIYAYTVSDIVDHGSTGTGMNSGQILTFELDQYYFRYAGNSGSGSAIVLQDVLRTTAGLVMAELMTGTPSGGVQTITSLHTTGVISVGGVVCIAPFGLTVLTSVGLTALAVDAALTACLVAADGRWVGQQKRFLMTTSVGVNGVVIQVSTAKNGTNSLPITTPATYTVSLVPDNSALLATWKGDYWLIELNNSVNTTA